MKNTRQKRVFSRMESEVRGYCRRFSPVFVSARGCILEDADGRQYIDFLAACGALNYGHNDPDMAQALIDHIAGKGLSAGLDLFTSTKGGFLETFNRLILRPRGMDYRVQFTGPTGANAVEAALKLARKVTGRSNVIAFTNGFHGVTLGALAATGNRFHRMGASLPNVTRFPYDGYMGPEVDTAEYLDRLLDDPSGGVEPPAAILLETVQGEGGLNVCTPEWLRRIEALARKHGALLIVDDIQAGCGRTGTFFSFEKMGVTPDLITLSKSISGFGLPMALVLIRPELDQWAPAEHNGTFRGNTHAFVTATVALEKFWHGDAFSRKIAHKARIVTDHLRQIEALIPGSRIKGRGMMQGIDVGSEKLASAICALAFKKGVMLETGGPRDEVIKIMAPLTTPENKLRQGLLRLRRAAAEAMGKPVTRLVPAPSRSRLEPVRVQSRKSNDADAPSATATDLSHLGLDFELGEACAANFAGY